jgi:hypothetical protein
MCHFGRRSWLNVKESFDKIVELRPGGYRDVREKLSEVNKQIRLQMQFEKAQECELTEERAEAISVYIEILTQDALYPEVAERLGRAKKEQVLLDKYKQAQDHLARKEWQAAIEAPNWIIERRADYKDAFKNLQRAQEEQDAKVTTRRQPRTSTDTVGTRLFRTRGQLSIWIQKSRGPEGNNMCRFRLLRK